MKLAVLVALVCIPVCAGATETVYVAARATVRWTVTPPPPAWTRPDFDDKPWSEAPMPLVGDARVEAQTTALLPAQKLPGAAMTVFVRVHFRVGAETLKSYALRARFAEGLVAWIDGHEVARRYVAAGATPADPAQQVHGPEPESFALPAGGGRGDHVLALEVHSRKPGLGPVLEAQLSGFDAIRIIRGPYLLRPGAREITIAWDTDLDAPGEIRFGEAAEYGHAEHSPLALRHHTLRLRNLKPAHSYHYSVLAGGETTADAVFHTLPGPDEPLRVVVYGDTRNGHEVHARLAEQVLKEDPDFVLSVGDLVDRGSEEADWQRFFEVAAPLLRAVAMVPTVGNHDNARVGEGLARFLSIFPPPPGAPEPGYYSFDAAGVHFTVLDSNQVRSPRQLAFCESDLARAQRARARFVAIHEGPWSVGFHGNNNEVIRSYVPLFKKYGVAMVFSGHDHDYERGRVDGLDYIVSGGGGAPLYMLRCGGTRNPCPPTTFLAAPEYHYVLLEVQRGFFRICPKRIDGSALEPCIELPARAAAR